MKLTFYGGTGAVTGANFFVEHSHEGKSVKILIDCGLMQGTENSERFNKDIFPYKPEEIDFLLVTHSHMDHIGRIPKLVKEGFNGKIISTPPTKDISEVLFEDALQIVERNARRDGVLPMYEKQDVQKALSLWDTIDYHQSLALLAGISIYLRDSGHILGSAMIELNDGKVKAVFTGDLGNSPSLLLPDTEPIIDANYIIMESVYGDRNHAPKDQRRAMLKEAIQNAIQNKSELIIPVFSVERTQMMLYEMNAFFEEHQLTQIPVFLDSPLAINVTKIYEKYSSYLNDKARAEIKTGDDIFKFPRLKATPYSAESQRIDNVPNPKVILAGSGMSNGGRIVRHEKMHAGDKNATILLVGYQAVGTLGRALEDGTKVVNISGEDIEVEAKVIKIEGYSSHKDSNGLTALIEKAAEGKTLKKVFAVMGEPKASTFLVQRLHDELGVDARFPEYGETVELK